MSPSTQNKVCFLQNKFDLVLNLGLEKYSNLGIIICLDIFMGLVLVEFQKYWLRNWASPNVFYTWKYHSASSKTCLFYILSLARNLISTHSSPGPKVIVEKSLGEVSLLEQDAFENVS